MHFAVNRMRAGGGTAMYDGIAVGLRMLVDAQRENTPVHLGLDDEVVSPTFTLVNRYPGPVTVDHLDFYRVEPEHDLGDIGVHEILDELRERNDLISMLAQSQRTAPSAEGEIIVAEKKKK